MEHVPSRWLTPWAATCRPLRGLMKGSQGNSWHIGLRLLGPALSVRELAPQSVNLPTAGVMRDQRGVIWGEAEPIGIVDAPEASQLVAVAGKLHRHIETRQGR